MNQLSVLLGRWEKRGRPQLESMTGLPGRNVSWNSARRSLDSSLSISHFILSIAIMITGVGLYPHIIDLSIEHEASVSDESSKGIHGRQMTRDVNQAVPNPDTCSAQGNPGEILATQKDQAKDSQETVTENTAGSIDNAFDVAHAKDLIVAKSFQAGLRENRELVEILQETRLALRNRKFDKAAAALEEANSLARNHMQTQRFKRFELLREFVVKSWEAMRKGMESTRAYFKTHFC